MQALARLGSFAAIYVAQYYLYMLIPNSILAYQVYQEGIVAPVAYILRWITADVSINGVQNHLVSGGIDLEVVRGCDGSGVLFLLIAAFVAFGGGFRTTLPRIMGAVGFVYLFNQMRLIVLFMCAKHFPEFFTPLHSLLLPTLFVVLAVAFFALVGFERVRPMKAIARA
jgi:exosortase family protein XrtM